MSDGHQFDKDKFRDDLRERIHEQSNARVDSSAGRPGPAPGLIPGIILVLVGTIFLLDHMGILHADNFWKFWPLLLIAVGLNKFFHQGSRAVGVGFVVVGALLQLHELGLTGWSWNTLWPLVLIAGGILMIWSRFEIPILPSIPDKQVSGGNAMVNEYAFFGGVERRVGVNNLRGGNISAIFGGVEIDFRSAEIEGEEAIINVDVVFGGIEITVPDRWGVAFQGQSIFAGYTDETRAPLPEAVGAPPRKTLILRGRCVFGGISVKN